MIEGLKAQHFRRSKNLSFEDVKGIAFGSGPGSFSGVRVACGIAYGIAFAKEIPINGVNTLEALAAINPNKNTISCIDARMKQMYLGAFESKNSKITKKGEIGADWVGSAVERTALSDAQWGPLQEKVKCLLI